MHAPDTAQYGNPDGRSACSRNSTAGSADHYRRSQSHIPVSKHTALIAAAACISRIDARAGHCDGNCIWSSVHLYGWSPDHPESGERNPLVPAAVALTGNAGGDDIPSGPRFGTADDRAGRNPTGARSDSGNCTEFTINFDGSRFDGSDIAVRIDSDAAADHRIRGCNVAEDMSVNAYLGDADFQWDGSNGDVMLEVPQVYTARYFETDSDGVEWEYRWVAAGPVGRCHLDHAFTDGDRQSEKIYIPIFNGSLNTEGTKLESKAGVFPLHNKTRAQFRTLCTAKGDKWCLDDVWTMHLLDTLFIVMFAGTNAQTILGRGRSEMPYDNAANVALQARNNTNYITIAKSWAERFTVGQGIGIGTSAGSQSVFAERTVTQITDSAEIESASNIFFDGDPVNITTDHHVWSCVQKTGATIEMQSANGRVEGVDGRTAVRFLYIEDWFGNMWQFRDGDNIKKFQHYYCNKRSSYADKVYEGDYFKVGYEASQTGGYVKKFGYDPEWPEIEICVDATGSSGTYFPDYYWAAEGGELVVSGGNANNGVGGGPFYRYGSNGSGNSDWNIGGRPLGRK